MNGQRVLWGVFWGLFLLLLGACGRGGGSIPSPAKVTATAAPTRTPTNTASPTVTPSPTPLPLAARVNGEPILLAEWEAEVQRLGQATETLGVDWDSLTLQREALKSLIVETLLAQGAEEAGYHPSIHEVQSRYAALVEEVGGEAALQARLRALGYPDTEAFLQALQRAIAAAWMREHIAEQVPQEVEHVQARQILLYTEQEAQTVYARLQQGADFVSLARLYDPETWGYLGWMPRKVWPTQEMEEVIFSLKPGTFSPVLSSPLGYHIVYVIARESRPLAPWAHRLWVQDALETWIQEAWSRSDIEVLLPLEVSVQGVSHGP